MNTKTATSLKKHYLKKKNRRLKVLHRHADQLDQQHFKRDKDFLQGKWLLGLLAVVVLGTVIILNFLS
jgi:hypothetical protein